MMDMKSAVVDYIHENYAVTPDHPFSKFPDYFVFRHQGNRKWFAVLMEVPYQKIGIEKEGATWILNTKNSEDAVVVLRQAKGILKAYHMNKEKWMTILLDGTIELKRIYPLIDDSFILTNQKRQAP